MASKSRKSASNRKSGSTPSKGASAKASSRASGSRSKSSGATPSRDDAEVTRLKALLELMQDHGLVELEIGADGHSVRMSKAGPQMVAAGPAYAAAPMAMPAPHAAGAAPAAAPETDPNLSYFLSPMVGTFYRAASPEAAPYSVVGDRVEADTTLCIIEAMKVFNEIKAEMSGTITDVLVENGEAVEYGQPLFAIQK